ncbi:MAG: hypothetical protein ACOCVF_01325 [bacterium]
MIPISYSAVVLDDRSRDRLIKTLEEQIPEGWEIITHHMTINMGEIKPEYEKYLGFDVRLIATHIGISDKAMAVKVEGFDTVNKIPHITVAINRKEGGKPVMSNQITNWEPLDRNIVLKGKVSEVPYNL